MSFLSGLMQSISERGRALVEQAPAWLSGRRDQTLDLMCRDLLSARGEASGVALASTILDRYEALPVQGKLEFLLLLVEQFGADMAAVDLAIAKYQAKPTHAHLLALHQAAEPKRQELIRRLNLSPMGTQRLVRMREDIFVHEAAHPELAALDADFRHLFSSWFNRGFLVLRPIDWKTPANILEKIIRYEAVHAIRNWDDLRRRLEPADRRCFAFFHPQIVDDPLIFVEIALTVDMASSIDDVLSETRLQLAPDKATTAVFYSISNCQEGLRGISFGNFLIKQVVQELQRLGLGLKTFVTLSPMPAFARWVAGERGNPSSEFLNHEIRRVLDTLDKPNWHQDPVLCESLKPVLLGLASAYIILARGSGRRVIDPVARFHLGNGARFERLNWAADLSDKGLQQSFGIMVNYLYDLNSIEQQHEAFRNSGTIASSGEVRQCLRLLHGLGGRGQSLL
jgi:malonyl-CoA decarboxylase